jgi:hypothetical protein
MTTHYFPDADEPAVQPFTQGFVRVRRVSDLMGVITGVVGFGERPKNQWKADERRSGATLFSRLTMSMKRAGHR